MDGCELTDAQRVRMQRKRQMAFELQKAKLTPTDTAASLGKVKKVKDSGGGFFIEEEDEILPLQNVACTTNKVVVLEKAPVTNPNDLICQQCEKAFNDSFLLSNFDEAVCNACRDCRDLHCLITRTDAKNRYLLKDVDLDQRQPKLKFILRRNPHNRHWGDMRLYLESHVVDRALEVWGSEEQLEAEVQRRANRKSAVRLKRFSRQLAGLRRDIARRDLGNVQSHEHQFDSDGEYYNAENDEYNKTCSTCGYVLSYEKL